MNSVLKIALFAGAGFLAYEFLKKNSSLLSPATIPVATAATGSVPGATGNVQENSGGIPTDGLIPGAYYAMDCSSGRYGNVYAPGANIPSAETRQIYIYNSGATQLEIYRTGTTCPAGTIGEGY